MVKTCEAWRPCLLEARVPAGKSLETAANTCIFANSRLMVDNKKSFCPLSSDENTRPGTHHLSTRRPASNPLTTNREHFIYAPPAPRNPQVGPRQASARLAGFAGLGVRKVEQQGGRMQFFVRLRGRPTTLAGHVALKALQS